MIIYSKFTFIEQDAANIVEHSKDKNVVLIGSSFIGQ